MATRYNDQAVLEHYHCACTFEILYEDQFNITLGMDEEEFVAHVEVPDQEAIQRAVLARRKNELLGMLGSAGAG